MNDVTDPRSLQPRKGEVFGPILERDAVTLLPVVRVRRWGSPRAVGAWVVGNGKAEWQPAFDLTRVVVSSNAVALVALIVLGPVLARVARRRSAR